MLKIKEIAIVLMAVLASLAAVSLFAEASDAEAGDAHELSIVVKGGDCVFKDCGETVPAYNGSGQTLSDGSLVGAGSYVLVCPDSLNNTEDKFVSLTIKSNGQDIPYETLKQSETSTAMQYYFIMPDTAAEVEMKFSGHKVIITGEGGSVAASKTVTTPYYRTVYPAYFFEGDTVRLTITANTGYEYVSMEITSGNAELVVSSTSASFKMPAEDVEISVVFAKLVVGKTITSGNVDYRLISLDPYQCVAVGHADGVTNVSISKTVRFGTTNATVVSIEDKAFYGCYSLTSVSILADASIGSKAFAWCDSLMTVTISGSVDTIGAGAFHGCTDIEKISLPSTLTSFGKGAFYGLTFTDLEGTKVLKKTPSVLGGHTFKGSDGVLSCAPEIGDKFVVDGLKYQLVPTQYSTAASASLIGFVESPVDLVADTVSYHGESFNVISIGSKAFYKCDTLKSVSFGTKMAEVGYKAFARCTSLESISMPTNVKMIDMQKISEYAFYGCTSLKEFTLPQSVYNNQYKYPAIMDSAFAYCTGLTSVSIVPGLTADIGDRAFYKCTSLTSLKLSSVRSIGEKAFAYCSGIESISMNNSIITIADHAFYGCSGLKTLHLGVNSIGYGAFSECKGLESVIINRAQAIDGKAFFRCIFFSAEEERLDVSADSLSGHRFAGTFNNLVMVA